MSWAKSRAFLVSFIVLHLSLAQLAFGSSRANSAQVAKDVKQWETKLRACWQELAKQPPVERKLALSLANLAAAVQDEKTIDVALGVFDEAEKQGKVPAEAEIYFAQLLLEKCDAESESLVKKYDSDWASVSLRAVLSLSAGRLLPPALQIFLQAYGEESAKDPKDVRKLLDIESRISQLYETLGRNDEATQWMESVTNSSELPDSGRAVVAYTLAVRFWKRSWDLTREYVVKYQPVPEAYFPQVRELVNKAYFYVKLAETLNPKYANAYFYEKLIAIEEMKIETDPEKKKAIEQRAKELQDRYSVLIKEQREAEQRTLESPSTFTTTVVYDKPYASGLPSLNFPYRMILAPPPPPPPPAAPAKPPIQ